MKIVEDASIKSEEDFRNLLKAFNIILSPASFEMFYDSENKLKIKEFIDFYS